MARRGQLVGDAYVRIHADSSAMDRELRREFNARKSGRASGDDWSTGFTEAVERGTKTKLERARQSLIAGAVGGKSEWDKQFRASGLKSVDDFVKAVEDRFQKLAGKKNLINSESIRTALEDLREFADDTKVQEAFKAQQRLGEQMAKDAEANLRKQRRDQEALGKAIINDWKDAEKAQTDYFNKTRTQQFALGQSIVRDMEKADRAAAAFRKTMSQIWLEDFKKQERAILDQDRAWQTYSDNVGRKLPSAFRRLSDLLNNDRSMERYAKRTGGLLPAALVRLDKRLDASAGHFTRFENTIGRVFGKGSRNNFLNFVGSAVGGLAHIGVQIGRTGVRILQFSGTFADVLGRGLVGTIKGIGGLFSGQGFGGITTSLKNMGKGIGELAIQVGTTLAGALAAVLPTLIGFGAALAALSVIIFPLIALVANLAGAIFVLASQIAVALAGALLAIAPAALALAGGFGTALLLIVDLKNEAKKTAKAMKPLNDAWAEMQKTLKGIPLQNFAKALGNLGPVFKSFITPLILGFTSALTIITNTFAALFTGPRIQPALRDFIETLPRILTNFGQGLAELSAGLIEFFQPILPFAEKLSENFEKLMTQFNDWANSAEGKNSIRDFMKNAWEAANDLWSIIGLVGEALGGLIGIATGADREDDGQTVLDSIKTALQNLVDFINSPEGAQAIKDFFTNAMTTASQLGDSIAEIADALKQVDWTTATTQANDTLDVIGKITSALTIFLASFGTQAQFLVTLWGTVGTTFVNIYNQFIGPALSAMVGALAAFLTGIGLLFRVLGQTIPGNDPFDQVADSIDGAIQQLAILSDGIRSIPDGHTNIQVTVSGEGARLLRAGASNTIAQRRLNTIFGAAAGGILSAPTFVRDNVVAGEAGREAIVPLDRPLALVDKSVRALAAFAQGQPISKAASGGILGGGNVNIQPGGVVITAPNSDPVLVAESVIDHLAAGVRI